MTIETTMNSNRYSKRIRTVASVGVSSNEEKPSYWIFNYLSTMGINIPVNPTAP